MKLLFRITLAKIKKDAKTSIFQAIAVLVSMFVISFFVCFVFSLKAFMASNPTFGIEAVGGESQLTIASLQKFFKEILSGIVTIASAVAALSCISLFIFARMRAEKNKRFLATLTSIGATSNQQKVISMTEALLLYGVPITLGSFLGFLPSDAFAVVIARIFVNDYSFSRTTWLMPLLLAAIGIAIVLLYTYMPSANRKKSVIESVKAHNRKEAGQVHSYRQSYTFRHMPIEKRIAKKGVAYYGSAYRRISFMLCSCALYPLLAFFFFLVSETSVSDYTPGYGINVGALAAIFAEKIALFGLLAFLALSAFGILEAAYVIRVHNRIRREAMHAYKSIGMTENSIKKVLKYEYRTAIFHAVLGLMFILTLLVVCINGGGVPVFP